MFGSGTSCPPATVVSVPIASLGFRTDIMLLALGGSAITKHGGLTVVATPPAPDFWWGNFVLAPDASALDAALALHAEMFPEADFVSVGIDGTDGLGIDATAAGRGLTVERSTALSSTAVGPPPRPNTDAEVRRLHSDEDFEAAADLQYTNDPASGRGFVASRFRTWRWLADEGHGAWFGAFLDGRLCTGLGLYTDGNGVARFQAVDTHPDYRRQRVGEPHLELVLLLEDADQPAFLSVLHRLSADQPGRRVQVKRLAKRQQVQRVQHIVGQLLDAGIQQRRQLRGDRGAPAQLPHPADLPQRVGLQRAVHQMAHEQRVAGGGLPHQIGAEPLHPATQGLLDQPHTLLFAKRAQIEPLQVAVLPQRRDRVGHRLTRAHGCHDPRRPVKGQLV